MGCMLWTIDRIHTERKVEKISDSTQAISYPNSLDYSMDSRNI